MNQFFYLKKQIVFWSLWNSGAKYVDNKMLRQIQNFSFCHGNASAKKKLLMTYQKPLHITLGMASACLTILPRTVIWFFNSWYHLFYLYILYCLLITHLTRRNRREHLSCWSPRFGFFVCPCYNRRTYYPTLEKPGGQNITVCENQGKQFKLSDHW